MKLIVAGASGFVATELIRQSLSMPKITSIIAARRPVSTPLSPVQGADASKLHSVILDDYGSHSDEVIKHFAGADACIWHPPLIVPFLPFYQLRVFIPRS